MMYKFSKRRQKVWLKNLNRNYQAYHDTGDLNCYKKHYAIYRQFKKHPRVHARFDCWVTNRLCKNGRRYRESVYYLRKK